MLWAYIKSFFFNDSPLFSSCTLEIKFFVMKLYAKLSFTTWETGGELSWACQLRKSMVYFIVYCYIYGAFQERQK